MLDGIYGGLLKDLFHAYSSNPTGVRAMEFRAAHEDNLHELDELGESPYVDRRDNCWRLKLLALVELSDEDKQAQGLLIHCRQLFDVLRSAYKKLPGSKVTLDQLMEKTGQPALEIRAALTYLMEGPVSGSRPGDLLGSEDVWVMPGESFLRYRSFDEVIKLLRARENDSSFAKRSRPAAGDKVPVFRREMRQGLSGDTQVAPSWYNRLPSNIQDLMWEIHFAAKNELSALPSMGLRAVVDWVCNDEVGDVGGLGQKLNLLRERGYITQSDRELIENVVEVGHASVHRSYFPRCNDLELVIRIIQRLLEGVYVLGAASESSRDSVPKRGEA